MTEGKGGTAHPAFAFFFHWKLRNPPMTPEAAETFAKMLDEGDVYVLMHFDEHAAETPKTVYITHDVKDAMAWLCEQASHFLDGCPEGYFVKDGRKLIEFAKAHDYTGFTTLWNGICDADKLLCYRRPVELTPSRTFDNALGLLAESAVRCLDD